MVNGPITAEVSNSSKFLPYLGFGYDSAFFSSSNISIGIDVGVLFGTNATSRIIAKGVAQTDLDAEKARLDSRVASMVEIYPVVMMTAKYRF